MSVIICNDGIFATIAMYAKYHNISFWHNGKYFSARDYTRQEIADFILAQNEKAYNMRYGTSQDVSSRKVNIRANACSAIHLYKYCDCLEYNICGNRSANCSVVLKLLDLLKAEAIRSSDEYIEAKWNN